MYIRRVGKLFGRRKVYAAIRVTDIIHVGEGELKLVVDAGAGSP